MMGRGLSNRKTDKSMMLVDNAIYCKLTVLVPPREDVKRTDTVGRGGTEGSWPLMHKIVYGFMLDAHN